jgi:selenide,water dikinase
VASEQTIARAVEVMSTLNRAASEAMLDFGDSVHAVTDVTGFGLLGHLSEMLGGGDVGVRLDCDAIPVLPDVADFVSQGVVPGGTRRNLNSVASFMDWTAGFTEDQQLVLADAQTSGGLLIAVSPDVVDALIAALRGRNTLASAAIGTFTNDVGRIQVV